MRIAVAGGTGRVGRYVVEAARARGHEAVVIARARGIDVRTGAGLDAALEGADAVVDALSVTTLSGEESVDFFRTTTETLLAAQARAGIDHHLALSIVAIEKAPIGYYAGKMAQEQLVTAGSVPWTILRATQFHEFAAQMYQRAKIGPFHVAPLMRTQPVAAREVGQRLIELAEAGPGGRAPDFAGPREEQLPRMIRAYARSQGSRAWLPAIALPGEMGRAQRNGSLLPGPGASLGLQPFDEWLRSPDAK